MRRVLLTSTLLAVLMSGCGADEEKFRTEYRPLDRQLLDLERDLANSIGAASGKSEKQIESQFGRLAGRTGALKQDVGELEPPDDLSAPRDRLGEVMGGAEAALRDIEKAAEDGDDQAAGKAALQVVAASQALRDARRRLERATARAR